METYESLKKHPVKNIKFLPNYEIKGNYPQPSEFSSFEKLKGHKCLSQPLRPSLLTNTLFPCC